MQPNPKNFCGGNYQDWLEVNLTDKCNGKCIWCVEKNGYHPKHRASYEEICEVAASTGKKNIILLGGEPTLHPNFGDIVKNISSRGLLPWVTTNGSLFKPDWCIDNLPGIAGVNISIHHFELNRNKDITGISLDAEDLRRSILVIHQMGAVVRLNCNVIKGEVDSVNKIRNYIQFAKNVGADKIRFAELKFDDEHFVDLAKLLDYKYGLNDNPFTDGCNSDAVIDGMPVNFRQMCGLNTRLRVSPDNPEAKAEKQVLYYDGKIYPGWMNGEEMTRNEILDIIKKADDDNLSRQELAERILIAIAVEDAEKQESLDRARAAFCMY